MLTWKLSEIRTKVRELTGQLDTAQISDSDLDALINDFYCNHFPLDVYVSELEGWFTQATASGDDGEYDVSAEVILLDTPMTLKDSDDVLSDVKFYQDKDKFFDLYPEDPNAVEGRPAAALLYGSVLYLRPKPDEVYTFRAAAIQKPPELSTDDSAPLDVRWGPILAYGTAILMKSEEGDMDGAADLSKVFKILTILINRKKLKQKSINQRAVPRF